MAAAIAGAVAAAGSNLLGSLGTAGMQWAGGKDIANTQMNFNSSMADRAEKSFTDAGLPKYYAYTSGNGILPAEKYQVAGSNFMSGGPVNSNLPVWTTPMQMETKSARPRPNANIPPWNQLGPENEMRQLPPAPFRGQNDRLGLGNGRYAGNFVQGGVMLNAIPRNVAEHRAFAGALQ